MPLFIAVALHDLRRRLRDRTALMLAFVAPFVLASIMGLAFGSRDQTAGIGIAVADMEGSPASRAYVDQVLAGVSLGSFARVVRVDTPDAAHRLYVTRRVAAAVTLLPGFTDAPPTERARLLRVESSDDRPFGDAVGKIFLAGMSLRGATESAVGNVLRLHGIEGEKLATAVAAHANAPPAAHVAEDAVIEQGSPLGYFGPSMAIVFLFMLVGLAANSLLAERNTGTMARLRAAPVHMGTVVAGKTLSIVALMLISVFGLWAGTTFAFGAHWGDPLAVAALSLAVVVAVGSLGFWVTVMAPSEGVAQVAAAAVGFVLALLGGNFFPPGSLPRALERLSFLTPNGWALEGFTTLSLDRGAFGDVVRPIVVLAVIAAVLGTASVVRLRTMMVKP